MSADRRPPKPLDPKTLETLALRYVERFATTEGKLVDYLTRKLRERGWAGEGAPDSRGLAARMVALGYIDDRAYAEAKAASLARRGLGARRVAQALHAARVGAEDHEAIARQVAEAAREAALAFARRRRIGPYGTEEVDRPTREKQFAAMMRAGHAMDLSRRIVSAAPGAMPDVEDF
ncbi:regulatory protein RecX [Sphingomonas fuzhouensis]|uniref:regulatory protein RecX n=1 Tax=Sphingomonas fuzhouensis TaxID=3106033 RepID=UPI002AFF709E|nr:RecX family transcriptional regulator [Sphingomonas sp. SGZ-02]